MKRNSTKKAGTHVWRQAGSRFFAVLLLLAGITLTSCDKCDEAPSPRPLPGGSCGTPPPSDQCQTNATVHIERCFHGSWDSVWLQLDNGQLLRPVRGLQKPGNLQAGQRIRVSYENAPYEPHFPTCVMTVMPPAHQTVKITCVSVPDSGGTGCNTLVTAESVPCGPGVWGNRWLRLSNGQYLQPWESNIQLAQLVNGQQYRIAYEPVQRDSRYDNLITCQAVPPASTAVRILCIESVQPH